MDTIIFPAADRRRDTQKPPGLLPATVYVAVRLTEGQHWMDLTSIDSLGSGAKEKSEATDRKIPGWAKVNPCVGIEQCRLTVVPDA